MSTHSSGYVIVQTDQEGAVRSVFWPEDKGRLYTRDEAHYWAHEDNAADEDGHTSTVAEVFCD